MIILMLDKIVILMFSILVGVLLVLIGLVMLVFVMRSCTGMNGKGSVSNVTVM